MEREEPCPVTRLNSPYSIRTTDAKSLEMYICISTRSENFKANLLRLLLELIKKLLEVSNNRPQLTKTYLGES